MYVSRRKDLFAGVTADVKAGPDLDFILKQQRSVPRARTLNVIISTHFYSEISLHFCFLEGTCLAIPGSSP